MRDFRVKMKDGTWGVVQNPCQVSWDVPSARPSAAEYSRWKMAHGGLFKIRVTVTVSWDVPSGRPSVAEYAGFARHPTIQAGRSIPFTVPGVLDHGGANFGGPR